MLLVSHYFLEVVDHSCTMKKFPYKLDKATTRGLSTMASIADQILDQWIHLVDLTDSYSEVILADLFRWHFILLRETDIVRVMLA